jgi:hypothetical protein
MSEGVPNPGAETVADGLTGSSASVESPEPEERLSALAGYIDETMSAWQRQATPAGTSVTPFAEYLADALIGQGLRRVVEDDDTIRRAAEAFRRVDRDQRYDQLDEMYGEDAVGCGGTAHPEPCGGCVDCHRAMIAHDVHTDSYWTFAQSVARAVVRALRGDTNG